MNSHPNKFRDVLHFASKTQSISSYSFVLINIYALIYRIYRKDVIHYIQLYHPYLYYIHIYTKDMMSGKLVQNAKKNTYTMCSQKCTYVYTIYIHISGGQKFMLLGADINLSGTVWSAADRIRKLILRGQCGMVKFHPLLN